MRLRGDDVGEMNMSSKMIDGPVLDLALPRTTWARRQLPFSGFGSAAPKRNEGEHPQLMPTCRTKWGTHCYHHHHHYSEKAIKTKGRGGPAETEELGSILFLCHPHSEGQGKSKEERPKVIHSFDICLAPIWVPGRKREGFRVDPVQQQFKF